MEQVAKPLHLHVEPHLIAHVVETPRTDFIRAERRGAAHGEVGPAREVLRAPSAQIRPHEREAQRVRCDHVKESQISEQSVDTTPSPSSVP